MFQGASLTAYYNLQWNWNLFVRINWGGAASQCYCWLNRWCLYDVLKVTSQQSIDGNNTYPINFIQLQIAICVPYRCPLLRFNILPMAHHPNQEVWTFYLGEGVIYLQEKYNPYVKYAVSVMKDGFVVGHVSREHSKVCYFFPWNTKDILQLKSLDLTRIMAWWLD